MADGGEQVGTVGEIWRYPVQSLRGERLAAAAVGPTGIHGDRAYGIVDPESGQAVTSAGGKKKWRDLVTFSARFTAEPGADVAPPVEIALPDGTRLVSDDPDIDRQLSTAIGQWVRFARLTEAAPAYALSPLHLLTTATLRQLGAHHPGGRFEAPRFRPNIVVESGRRTGFPETGWIGRELTIGPELRLRITDHCKRCVMTVLPQGDLPLDPAILQTVRERNATRAGVYAEVIRPGPVRTGDTVILRDAQTPTENAA